MSMQSRAMVSFAQQWPQKLPLSASGKGRAGGAIDVVRGIQRLNAGGDRDRPWLEFRKARNLGHSSPV